MYPAETLSRLARDKDLLRQRIARHRATCVTAAGRVAQPLAWLDQLVARWRRLPPLVRFTALPIGLALGRAALRHGRFGRLLRWGPIAAFLVHGLIRRRAGPVAG